MPVPSSAVGGVPEVLRCCGIVVPSGDVHGLAVGLKNDLDQVALLQGSFDFAVVEQCFQLSECWKLQPFLPSAKSVFEVEYNLPRSTFCPRAERLGINALRAQPSLVSPGTPCD